ncbi:sugar phosphate isomerase/epimerase family protein [Pseudomonas sp. NA-150]|uniref:sugar phosphate isomerase/epimerase family protein n=1 Tax=Pseudomonas sp. NA-150 TaxID=3367525 RepID=UPI0037CAB6A2
MPHIINAVAGSPARALSVCGITTRYLSFEEDVRVCSEAGMNGISLWWDKIKACGVDRGAKVLRDAPLAPVSMVGLPCMLTAEGRQDRQVFDLLRGALDDCATLGVGVMGVVPGNHQGRTREQMDEATVDVLVRLGEEARQRGVTLALEPVHEPYLDYLNTLVDAERIVKVVNSTAVGILFDAWHLCHEPELDRRIEETASRIALVHFSDWREPTRCHDDRLLPGEGVLPLKSILTKLHQSGYRGYFDVEVFSEEVWRADPLQNLNKCRAFFDSVWAGKA